MDYLKFGKLIYDDWKSDSCISNYLKEVLNKSVSSKKKKMIIKDIVPFFGRETNH